MRVVERPALYPSVCVALPYVGPSRTRRWIDTQAEVPAGNKDWHVYVSDIAAMEMASLVGYVPAAEVRVAQAQMEGMQREIDALRAELARAEAHLDAVDLLESRGFTARKKPGRPKQGVEA